MGAVDTDTVMAVDTVMGTHIGMVVTTDVVTTDTTNKHHQKFQKPTLPTLCQTNISKSTNYEFWIDLFNFRHELINENFCNTFSIFTNLLCNIKRYSCTYFKKKYKYYFGNKKKKKKIPLLKKKKKKKKKKKS